MSLLNYGFTPISKTATASGTSEQTEGTNHDGLSDEDSSDIDSAESDNETQSAVSRPPLWFNLESPLHVLIYI